MNVSRSRTFVLALSVVTGSALTGVGLGRFLAKDARAAAATVATAPVHDDVLPQWPRIIPYRQSDLAPNPPQHMVTHIAATTTPIPLWTYNITSSRDGNPYSGKIMGRSPFAHGKTTTTIPTQIIPLTVIIDNGSGDVQIYDPLADPCGQELDDVDFVQKSPIFQNNPWTMNGQNIGNTQYIDAFQRAEFWSLVKGSNYHLILNPTVLPPQTLIFGSAAGSSGPGANYAFAACSDSGVIQIADWDAAIKKLLVANPAVNPGTFPILLVPNILLTAGGLDPFHNCCILGYHSAYPVGPNAQIYSPFSLQTAGIFGPGFADVSVLAHEMGEAVNDPLINNATPHWGNIGQTGGCQGNFEVGDPLTGTNFPPIVSSGFTYNIQELAFFSWFYGGPSLGSGGAFSANGTFTGDAKACPPGGTN